MMYSARSVIIPFFVFFFHLFKICIGNESGEEVLKIVGGEPTDPDRYSYQAIIGIIRNTRSNVWRCGGTLIAPDVIITAGRCIPEKRREQKKFGAQIGRYDLSDKLDSIGKDVKEQVARRIKIHPMFNDFVPNSTAPSTYDVALMFFPNRFARRPNDFENVKLNKDSQIPVNGDTLSVIGYAGFNNETGAEFNEVKLETTVTYDEECTAWGDDYVPNIMLCGDGGGKNDTCYSDRGGPILMKGNNDTSDIQVGITSWGSDCGSVKPRVYTRLSDPVIMDWISEEVCKRSVKPPSEFNCTDLCFDTNKNCTATRRNCRRKRFHDMCCASCKKFEE